MSELTHIGPYETIKNKFRMDVFDAWKILYLNHAPETTGDVLCFSIWRNTTEDCHNTVKHVYTETLNKL